MGKQPYIPFYVGDYLKDTRVLPLSVRGAWVDLILFMWDAPVRGELVGTIEDFARMMSCEKSEAEFALSLLKQKRTADFDLLPTGELKIVSRKMKREHDISKKRSVAGKKGVEAKKEHEFAEAKATAKHKQNTEYDIEYEYDIEIKIKESFDEIYLDQQKMKWPHLDFDYQYRTFCEKVRGSPEFYRNHETLRLAFQKHLRDGKPPSKTKQSPSDLATAFAKRVVQSNGGK